MKLTLSIAAIVLAGCTQPPTVEMAALCEPYGGVKEFGWDDTSNTGTHTRRSVAAYCKDGGLVSRITKTPL